MDPRIPLKNEGEIITQFLAARIGPFLLASIFNGKLMPKFLEARVGTFLTCR